MLTNLWSVILRFSYCGRSQLVPVWEGVAAGFGSLFLRVASDVTSFTHAEEL